MVRRQAELSPPHELADIANAASRKPIFIIAMILTFSESNVLGLVAGLMAAFVAPDAATSRAICDVGRVALRDLPTINQNRGYTTYYANSDPNHQGLLDVCQNLRKALPAGYPFADKSAWARAKEHVPMLGGRTPPTLIATIEIPGISADLKQATVEMGYTCTGLCGASFVAHYVRTSMGWQLDGKIQPTLVS